MKFKVGDRVKLTYVNKKFPEEKYYLNKVGKIRIVDNYYNDNIVDFPYLVRFDNGNIWFMEDQLEKVKPYKRIIKNILKNRE